ncbi:MAG: heavy metal translocating P-type ATPase metal-binding domain-containing protein [Archangium sp.]|nr:heavy metal translocating P-type ATPase metal-binding domain-containing protein [Archangium sp.]
MQSAREAPETAPRPPCEHCGTLIPADAGNARFCCRGCEAVHNLLHEQGLDRYYALAGNQVSAVNEPTPRSHSWLEPLVAQALANEGEVATLQLDVQGIHCAACVWLMNETFGRRRGAGEITVNPTLGTVRLHWKKGELELLRWVEEVEAFGYQFGPARKEGSRRSVDLPVRLGISAAIAINVMLFSVSFYFGLSPDDPEVFKLFTGLSFVLSTATVFIGGWPFFQAAVRGLRSGVLHLDLPIAMGIGLVYGMSVVQLFTSDGRGDLAYFDTLNTFITLMLLGRFLQERMLEKNRRYLLEDDGAEGLMVRRVIGSRLESVKAPQVVVDDVLLVAPGDLVPVDAVLLQTAAQISTDWMTGEAAPRRVEPGAMVPAGSFNAGRTAFHVRATQDFSQSSLVALLRQPARRVGGEAKHHQLWNRLAKRWVVTVLGVSSLGFLLWLPRGMDAAVNVMVSLLVITCPCAIGIAIPLAYELVQSRLRKIGFFVRSTDLLDRLTEVKQLVFDKTGTLTLGRLELVEPLTLEATSRDVAYNLAVRSSHPVSSALARALENVGAQYDASAQVEEVPGRGMEWRRDDGRWRLGRADWATGGEGRVTSLGHDGRNVATLETREVLRSDARAELGKLGERYAIWLLSGDAPSRVETLAKSLGLKPGHAIGGLSPEAKAEQVKKLSHADALYLGDGVNDALAFEAALAAGTPAIDRPVMPSKSDFFLVGEGLAPIQTALEEAHRLRRVIRRVLTISLAYNVLAISCALLGVMTPVAAAISMPASTLTLLLITVSSLRRREEKPTTSLVSLRPVQAP